MITVGYPSDLYPWSNLVALYTVAATVADQPAFLALATAVISIFYYFTAFPEDSTVIPALFTSLAWVLAWGAGRSNRGRRREAVLAAERDVSQELAAARQSRLDTEERRRQMARELHDLIGHTINVMVVHAGAGRLALASDPEAARRALETIEETGRAALGELDGVLGILRSGEEGSSAPLPGLADLDRLIGRFEEAGLATRLSREVDGPVPRSVGATAYRIVQEALTNTLKHARASSATVRLAVEDGNLEVSVADDGRGSASEAGSGLTGMAERVGLHGGTVRHGNRPEGGYEVVARIPIGEPS
jgi:signal transduction histidine kinase